MGCGSSNQQPAVSDSFVSKNKAKSKKALDECQECTQLIQQIISTIDLLTKIPELLQTLKGKLIQLQGLLSQYNYKKFKNAGLDPNFLVNLTTKLNEINTYVFERVKVYKGQVVKMRMDDLISSIEPDIEQLIQTIMFIDNTDNFLIELKKKYKGKPGYQTWKLLFSNKIQIPKETFIQKYAIHNELSVDQITIIADFIDLDKNQVISFEEFMTYITNYQYLYDQNGSIIKDINVLLQLVLVETQTHNIKQQVNDRQIQYQDEVVYEGDILNGMRHGKGKLSKPSEQYTYEGDFCNDAKHGFGIEIKNRTRYEGEWKNNQKFGKGKITYFDNSTYEGEFKCDLCDGQGKLILSNKTICQGKFVDNAMVEGVITYQNGERYEGQTRDNIILHGRGKLFDATGKLVKEGNFSSGAPSVKFEYCYPEDKEQLVQQCTEITNLVINVDNHERHDPMLLANLSNLQILSLTFSDYGDSDENSRLTVKLLQNMHSAIVGNLQELHLNIPNEVNKKTLLKKDFIDLFQALSRFTNLTTFDLQLSFWGAENQECDGQIIDNLVQCFQSFKNIKHLCLNLSSWGLSNKSLKHDEVVRLVQGIEYFQSQLLTLTLDLGKWGCTDYESLDFFSDQTIKSLSDLLKIQVNLEELNLNIRSWAFKNKKITNSGFGALLTEFTNLTNLKRSELTFRGMAYENDINQELIQNFSKNLPKLVNMESLRINFQYCDNFIDIDILYEVTKNLTKLDNFRIIL